MGVAESGKKRSAFILRWAKKIKGINMLGGRCKGCGNDNIFELEFHHNESREKEKIISALDGYRWSKIEEELRKCTLLCGNCHSLFHYADGAVDPKNSLNKIVFLQYKGLESCEICDASGDYQSMLCFHHTDPETKLYSLSDVTRRFYSVEALDDDVKEEIDKCVVLCVNCHKSEHAYQEIFEKYKEQIYYLVDNYKEPAIISTDEVYYWYFEKDLSIQQVADKLGTSSKGTIHYHIDKIATLMFENA